MALFTSTVFLFVTYSFVCGDLTSIVKFQDLGTDFIPANQIEFRGAYLSVLSKFQCAVLCHEDPQCRTIVFDFPSCRLYEGSLEKGSVIPSLSANSVVGNIDYDNIDLSSRYNQSCNYCYPDRYLVCRNNTCQCPLNTFWNGQDKCVNQLYVNSVIACQNNGWCREDLNLTCSFLACECPMHTFWNDQTCEDQFLAGIPCNTTDQCRNDLNLTCSHSNKTCQGN